MGIDKKKITFAVVIAAVLIFIIAYSLLTFGGNDAEQQKLVQPLVPTLEPVRDDYTSRLDAVDDLRDERETNAPSIYNEKLLDSTGMFDPDLIEKEKMRMVDSIYNSGRIDYSTGTYRNPDPVRDNIVNPITKEHAVKKDTGIVSPGISVKEMDLGQQLFFASDPLPSAITEEAPIIKVIIDKKQVIKTNDRLEMRTQKACIVNGGSIPKNTIIFGIVSFRPNRVLLKIENINHRPFLLKAYDQRDGLEGIYIKNSFRAEATREIVDDAIDGINVPGVPRIKGFKKIFQRSNAQVKVTVNTNYELILKVDDRQ